MNAGPALGRAAALAGLLALAACKDEKATAPQPADPVAERALRAVEQNIVATAQAAGQTRFRGMTVFAQAQPGRLAVCGQVTPFADDPNIFVPFVSVVTFGGQPGGPSQDQFELLVGNSTTEAGRVYAAIVADCWAGGGRAATPLRSAAPTPPLPDAIPDPAAATQTPPAAGPASQAHPAIGAVTVRQSATVHAEPRGPSVRTVARGTSLHVFGQAPGGWYQVGDSAPWGWVHESMLERP